MTPKSSQKHDHFVHQSNSSFYRVWNNKNTNSMLKSFLVKGPLGKLDTTNNYSKISELHNVIGQLVNKSPALTDFEIAEEIKTQLQRNIFKNILEANDINGHPNRAQLTAQEMEKLVQHVRPNWIPESYLDIGTQDGEIINAIKSKLKVSADKTYALDNIKISNQTSDYITLLGSAEKLPKEIIKDSIDLVSLFVTLHHLDSPEKAIEEIHKVVRPLGLVVIREHDYSPDNKLFTDYQRVVELFFDYIYPKTPHYFELERPENYNSIYGWSDSFTKHGFEVIYAARIPGHTLRSFYGVFEKRQW